MLARNAVDAGPVPVLERPEIVPGSRSVHEHGERARLACHSQSPSTLSQILKIAQSSQIYLENASKKNK